MTGAAVDGQCCGPPGRLGLAWLLDAVAKRDLRPVAQIGYWEHNDGVTYQDPEEREIVFASGAYRPTA